MSDIFISYAREDKERVKPLAKVLEARGWSVWWDPHISFGQHFDEVIEQALKEARCVVVIWSINSISSRWVRAEANEGFERGTLVPVLIEDVRVPLAFRQIQTANLINWDGSLPHTEFEKLISDISLLLGPPAVTNSTVILSPPDPASSKKVSGEPKRKNILFSLQQSLNIPSFRIIATSIAVVLLAILAVWTIKPTTETNSSDGNLIYEAKGDNTANANTANAERTPALPGFNSTNLFSSEEAANWDTSKSLDQTVINEVVSIAGSQVGVMENPRGSNRGPEVDEYIRSVGLSPEGQPPWAQAFVYWCFDQATHKAGVSNPVIKTASMLDFFGKAVQRKTPIVTPAMATSNPKLVRPGMIFVIEGGVRWGHSGIVEKVEGDEIVTVEGNTNDGGSREGIGVLRRRRKIVHINKGFVYFGK